MKNNHSETPISVNGILDTQVAHLAWSRDAKQNPVLLWTLEIIKGLYQGNRIYHQNVLDDSPLSYFNLRRDLLAAGLMLTDCVNTQSTKQLQSIIGQPVRVEIESHAYGTRTTLDTEAVEQDHRFYLAAGIPATDEEIEEFSQSVEKWFIADAVEAATDTVEP